MAPSLHEVDGLRRRGADQPVLNIRRTIKERVYSAISPEVVLRSLESDPIRVRRELEDLIRKVITEGEFLLPRDERQRAILGIIDEILGYGPLEPLLSDASISEIMVNGPNHVFIERSGRLHETDITFESEDHLMRIIDKILGPTGRRVDESSPMVDARLPDGSRVNVVIPPLAISGPVLTVRKFRAKPFTLGEMIEQGSVSEEMAGLLDAYIKARLNVIVTGGTGSGKTTLLNTLSSSIEPDERVVSVEDSAELRIDLPHVVALETRPASIDGKGLVPIRSLVVNALRMRPDRIIVGEVRGGEALDMLQAMNTGHDGSLTTLHANSPRDAISRLEAMVMMAGTNLPSQAIREQIVGGIDLVVHLARLQDGSRKVTDIAEVAGLVKGRIALKRMCGFDLFDLREESVVAGEWFFDLSESSVFQAGQLPVGRFREVNE